MDGIIRDLRHALRGMFRDPGFTVVAVLTLALGIGVTTAVFSFTTALMSARIPGRSIDRVLGVWSSDRNDSQPRILVSTADFMEWDRRQQSFESFAAQHFGAMNLSGIDQPVRVRATFVTSEIFNVVGNGPVLGRAFWPEENQRGAAPVAILSQRFWRERFDAKEDAVGRDIRLNGIPTTIVGVLPPDDFSPDVLVPLTIDPASPTHNERVLAVSARLKDGVTLEQAGLEMQAIGEQIAREQPDTHNGWGITVRPYREEFFDDDDALALALIALTSVAVLLIACANVANLLLARGVTRGRELALRTALGASRRRLVALMLAEAFLLALAGSLIGLIVATWGLSLLRSALAVPGVLTIVMERAVIDGRVLGFAVVACVMATLCFGLLPALRTARGDVVSSLKEGGRTGEGRRHRRLRELLVTGQVSVAVLLLVIATLLLRTVGALQQIEPGFDTTNLLTMSVSLPDNRYPTNAETTAFFDGVLDRLRSSPGVVTAAAGGRVPAAGSQYNPTRDLVIEGMVPAPSATLSVSDLTVTPGYLETLRVPLLDGRMLERGDHADAPLAVVINQTMARRFWGTTTPIGARIRLGDEVPANAWRSVVGVVADIRNDDIGRPPLPYVFVPLSQRADRDMTIILRTAGDPMSHVPAVRAAIAAVDADQPLSNVQSMDQILSEDMRGPKVFIGLSGIFAAMALALAAIGIYGVVAFSVAQRRHDIGVRMAVGAAPANVLRLVVREGLAPVVLGLGIGLVSALALSRLLTGILYGVTATDPITYVAVSIVLIGVALLACAIPVRRAVQMDPLIALRHE
jgi:putative ABC transport system permease protein